MIESNSCATLHMPLNFKRFY